jgi:hypothetical protein
MLTAIRLTAGHTACALGDEVGLRFRKMEDLCKQINKRIGRTRQRTDGGSGSNSNPVQTMAATPASDGKSDGYRCRGERTPDWCK